MKDGLPRAHLPVRLRESECVRTVNVYGPLKNAFVLVSEWCVRAYM